MIFIIEKIGLLSPLAVTSWPSDSDSTGFFWERSSFPFSAAKTDKDCYLKHFPRLVLLVGKNYIMKSMDFYRFNTESIDWLFF